MNKILKRLFRITVERPRIKVWRGHRVPVILYVRRHTYVGRNYTGSYVWFNLIGPNFSEWCKKNWRRVESNQTQG